MINVFLMYFEVNRILVLKLEKDGLKKDYKVNFI